ncbi:MAG: hypothetical protein F6J98_01605 [Moorea sp. SIO4G2]|nr:hypothetical protein [Moorena sp. SIO4G2]
MLDIEYSKNEEDGSLILYDVPLVNQENGNIEYIDVVLQRLSFRQKQRLVTIKNEEGDEAFIYKTASMMVRKWGEKNGVTVEELSSVSSTGYQDRCDMAMEVINKAVENFLPQQVEITFRERKQS